VTVANAGPAVAILVAAPDRDLACRRALAIPSELGPTGECGLREPAGLPGSSPRSAVRRTALHSRWRDKPACPRAGQRRACSSSQALTQARGAFQLMVISFVLQASM